MSSIKRIDIREFRERGYLQELNRQFLHPLGLALEVVILDDGSEELGGVWDYRSDSEGGIRYGYNDSQCSSPERLQKAREKMEFVKKEQSDRVIPRKVSAGHWIEPIPGKE